MNTDVYIDILRQVYIPYARTIWPEGLRLMQDNGEKLMYLNACITIILFNYALIDD